MKSNVFAIAALIAALGAASAYADDGEQRKQRVEKLDTNGDGVISRAEAGKAPRLAKSFDAIDANKDGQLSKEELAAFRKAHAGKPHAPTPASGS